MKRFTAILAVVVAACCMAFGQYAPPTTNSFLGLSVYPWGEMWGINGHFLGSLTVNGVSVLTNIPAGTLTNGALYATAAQGAKADTALQSEADPAALAALGVASNALHVAVTGETGRATAAEAS